MSILARSLMYGAASLVFGAGANAMYSGLDASAHAQQYDTRAHTTFKQTFQSYVLGERKMLAEDVAVFRFLLPHPDDVFDLKPCSTLQSQHASGSNRIEQLQRSYTPITPNGTKGYFDIVVKKQHRGRMTEHLFSMKPGESLQFRVSIHKLHYVANRYKYVGCLAGGTGISSVLQVIREICDNPEDKTRCTLLYGNQSEGKILLRGLLDGLAEKHSDKFRVTYTIDKTDDTNKNTWKGLTGHINSAMIEKLMPPPQRDNLILVCGPDPMMHALCGISNAMLKTMSGGLPHQPLGGSINNHQQLGGVLADLGYDGEQVYRF